jgi:hypothetical protein
MESPASSFIVLFLVMPQRPHAAGGIVIETSILSGGNTRRLRPKKEAESSDTSRIWVKREEEDAPSHLASG